MSEEVNNQAVEIEEKDITSLIEDVEEDIEEIEELASEEMEEVEEEPSELMTEEEFNERIDDFAERDHIVTKMICYAVSKMEKDAEKYGFEIETGIWWNIGRPSLNSGLWYLEKVKGQVIRVSGELGLLVGLGSLLLLGKMYMDAMKTARKKRSSINLDTYAGWGHYGEDIEKESKKKKKEKKEEKPVKTPNEKLRENAKPKEPEKPKSEMLAKIAKNLGS